jgi:hypothetical protein
MNKLLAITAALAMALSFTACPVDGGVESSGLTNGDGTLTDAAFESHNTDYSILVRNNTGERLVAFKGDLRSDALIGGIPGHAQGHGLPKDPALFDRTQEFPLILLTEAQYNANRDRLPDLKNTPFTRVYVFYNASGDNTAVYEIAGGLGGTNSLEIINESTMNVELRLGGIAGETIGYAPAGMLTTTLKLMDGSYFLFPVFKKYNPLRDTVETVYPKQEGGAPWRREFSFGDGDTALSINLKTALQGCQISSGAALVYVNNQTNGGIRFISGSQVFKTASGNSSINSGSTNFKYFQIDMPKVTGTNDYAPSITAGNWKFGPTGSEAGLRETENGEIASTITISQGKMYSQLRKSG